MSEIILLGDASEQLKKLEPESVHACITSPPYYNLRDYGTEGQIGTEETPERYIDRLVEVFREVRRVLRPDGTLWVNIGDSYATRSGRQPPTNTRNRQGHTEKRPPSGYKYKDLIGIPWMLAFALRADGWYLRQDIIWNKPNCMPESVKDRCTKSHEYIFLLAKSEQYFFDGRAISEPLAESTLKKGPQYFGGKKGREYTPQESDPNFRNGSEQWGRTWILDKSNPTGRRNKRDVWTVNTGSFRGAHFAVFPPALIRPCILAGCPPGGVVLDPFTGSGTTGEAAKQLHRDFVGVEINPQYHRMAVERIAAAVPEVEQITLFTHKEALE